MSDDKEKILLGLKYAAVLESITDDSLSSLASALDGDLKDAFAKVTGLSAEAYATPASPVSYTHLTLPTILRV